MMKIIRAVFGVPAAMGLLKTKGATSGQGSDKTGSNAASKEAIAVIASKSDSRPTGKATFRHSSRVAHREP